MKPESWESKKMRWGFNLFPAYRGSGGRITYISGDFHELHVRVRLHWRTRNYVGTIYGGSMYGAVDPIYMLMLMKILGNDFVVWDKAAAIRFKRPAKKTLTCQFIITPEEVENILAEVSDKGEVNWEFQTALIDTDGVTVAEIDKTIYIATKAFYKEKLARKTK